MGPNVGHAIGVRLASGKRVSVRLRRSLSEAQVVAMRMALSARGKCLSESFLREVRKGIEK